MAGPLYEQGSDVVGVKRCPRDALALACRARGRRYRYVLRTYDPRSPCGAMPPLQERAVTRTSRNGKPSPLPANYGRRGDGLNDGPLRTVWEGGAGGAARMLYRKRTRNGSAIGCPAMHKWRCALRAPCSTTS